MLCTIARDITERKKIGERYRNLLRSVSDIIRETDDNLVFTFITPRVYESLGRTPEEGPGITKSSGRM